MNRWLTDAYRADEDTIPDYSDAAAAMAGARRRRIRLLVGAPVVLAVLVAGGFAATADTSRDSAPSQSATKTSTNALDSRPGGFTGFLYRSCEDECSITMTRAGTTTDLASDEPAVAADLAERGLDGVALSHDGEWLGVPDGTGFTLHNLDDSSTIELPAGSPGTRWQAYYWIWEYGLVLAQWNEDTVVQYALVNTLSLAGFPEVALVAAPDNRTLVPMFSRLDQLYLSEVVDVTAAPADRPVVTSLAPWQLSPRRGAEVRPPTGTSELALCMLPGETLAGPDGAPVEFMSDMSSSQLTTKVTFRVEGEDLVPSGILRGPCADVDNAAPPEQRRYDLPRSTADDTWTMLGPIPHAHSNRATLMGHVAPGSDVMELVAVGYDGTNETVAELPADAEVLMTGMTYGQLG